MMRDSRTLAVVVVVLATAAILRVGSSRSGGRRVARTAAFVLDPATRKRASSSSSPSSSFVSTRPAPSWLNPRRIVRASLSARDDDEEDEEDDGMEAAFRRLDNLESLDASSARPSKKSNSKDDEASSSSLPLEKEISVYKDLVGELESKEDVYGNVLADMGTSKGSGSKASSSSSLLDDPAMQQALAEALQQVKQKDSSAPSSSSVLNDKEIMKEIEEIMERGNAELLASLEDIRREQVSQAHNISLILESWTRFDCILLMCILLG